MLFYCYCYYYQTYIYIIYIYLVLHHFILLIICLAQAFSSFYGPRSQFLISAFRNASQKRSSQRASGHTPPAPGVRPAAADGAPVESEEAAPVCLAGLKRWAQNQYLAVPLFDWEVVADKPRNHFHASPFPSSLQEDEDSSFHAKTAMLSGLGLCNGAVHSSVPFRPSMYESRSNATARRNPWGRSSWCRNAAPKQKRKFAKHNFFEQKKSAQTAAPAVKVEENIACVGQRPFERTSSEGLSLL